MTLIRPKRKRTLPRPKRKNYYLRDRPSTRFSIGSEILPAEFCAFAEDEVWPCLATGNWYKTQEKLELATHCVHALITTGLVDSVVADDRSGGVAGARGRCKVWDALIDAGFARKSVGSEESRKVTRYAATAKLLRLRDEWELRLLVDLNLERNIEIKRPTDHALVILHTGKIDLATGQPLAVDQVKRPLSLMDAIVETWPQALPNQPTEHAIAIGLKYWKGVVDSLNAINLENLRHSWIAFNDDGIAFQPNPCLRQIHCGELFRGARLYSWSALSGQNLSKATRTRMLIDGKRTAELDFSCLHIRMLHHVNQLDPDPHEDLYRPGKVFPTFWKNAKKKERAIVRDFLKQATNILLNTRSQGRANSSVGKLLKDHDHRHLLRQVIHEVEGTSPKGVVQRIVDCHPDIAKFFFCETGMWLMGMDGAMMHDILKKFVLTFRKPALAIHDALVVRRSDKKKARQVMAETYQKYFQFQPSIHREF